MRIKYFIIGAIFTLCVSYQGRADEHVDFRPLTADEVPMALALYQHDDPFQEAINSHFINVPKDIRIAYYDLNDDGEDEILLYLRSGYTCGSAGCEVDIWQRQSGQWKRIGSVDTVDKGITILSKKKHGFHMIHGVDNTFYFNGKEY